MSPPRRSWFSVLRKETPGPVRETPFAELLATTATPPDIAVSGEDLAVLPYSSGTTTGLPKGVMLTHRNLVANVRPSVRALALAKSPLVNFYDLSSVDTVISATAPLDGTLAKNVSDRVGATVLQDYGLTESSSVTHGIPFYRPDIDPGSIGVLMPNVEARVVDVATGTDMTPGEIGELWCRGPNIMRGYLDDAQCDSGGVGRGRIPAHWRYRYVRHPADDAEHAIGNYRGHRVAPAELEALLLSHDAIADAAVIIVSSDSV